MKDFAKHNCSDLNLAGGFNWHTCKAMPIFATSINKIHNMTSNLRVLINGNHYNKPYLPYNAIFAKFVNLSAVFCHMMCNSIAT